MIAETAQIDLDNPEQKEIFKSSTISTLSTWYVLPKTTKVKNLTCSNSGICAPASSPKNQKVAVTSKLWSFPDFGTGPGQAGIQFSWQFL